MVSTFRFLKFWPKILFWANLGQKSESCPFCLKIDTQSISRMISLILILVFWISSPKSIFGQIWTKKVNVVCFAWKWTDRVWWDADSFPTLIFSIFNPKYIFWQVWTEKVKINMFMILFPPDHLHYFNLEHCVPYVVFIFCELVIL